MPNTLITVVDYPETFSFITRQKLPKFSFDCQTRYKILQKKLRQLNVDSAAHDWKDFNIEQVVEKYGQEFWYLGT